MIWEYIYILQISLKNFIIKKILWRYVKEEICKGTTRKVKYPCRELIFKSYE